MTDCCSPTFFKVFCPSIKSKKKRENSNIFTCWINIISGSRVFYSGIKMGVNIVCTLFFTEKPGMEH